MGLDDAPQEILERTALLDAETGERIGETYGSVTPPITSERLSIRFTVFASMERGRAYQSSGQKSQRRQSTFVKRAKYYVPSLAWIPNYSFSLYVHARCRSCASLTGLGQIWRRFPRWGHSRIHAHPAVGQLRIVARETKPGHRIGE